MLMSLRGSEWVFALCVTSPKGAVLSGGMDLGHVWIYEII